MIKTNMPKNQIGSCEVEEKLENNNSLKSNWTLCVQTQQSMNKITVIMRSAERVDRVFGSAWTETEKFVNKVYPTDLNVPKDANLHPHFYRFNPPITYIGKYSTQLNARALQNRGIRSSLVFCSPTLRTVQTAAAIAKSNGAKICIEPGLLEPLEWYRMAGAKELPDFCGELIAQYPNIDRSHKPIFTINEMRDMFETRTQEQCIQRIQFVVRNICGAPRDGTAIVVGHAITMDIAARIGEHGDRFSDESADECTSYEDSTYNLDPKGQAAKLELGVRYPPGSVMALVRLNDSPPYVLQNVAQIIPPLTSGNFSNSVLK